MFYVTTNKDGVIGVIDSKDGIEEFYSKSQIEEFRNKRYF